MSVAQKHKLSSSLMLAKAGSKRPGAYESVNHSIESLINNNVQLLKSNETSP